MIYKGIVVDKSCLVLVDPPRGCQAPASNWFVCDSLAFVIDHSCERSQWAKGWNMKVEFPAGEPAFIIQDMCSAEFDRVFKDYDNMLSKALLS